MGPGEVGPVEEGPVDQIYDDPQHPYTVGLLDAVPKLTDEGDRPLRMIEGLPPMLIDLGNLRELERIARELRGNASERVR